MYLLDRAMGISNYFKKERFIMKKSVLSQKLFPAAAFTLAIGAATVLGNGWAMAQAFAANISAELPASVSGEAVEAARPTVVNRETSAQGEDGTATVVKTPENGINIIVSYVRDGENPKADVIYNYGDGRQETYSYEGEAAAAAVERFGGEKRDSPYSYEEGRPGESDVTRDEAVSAALEALTGKYALRQETLDRFGVTAAFYSVYEDLTAPIWRVYLYPADTDDFAEIGCYTALIDAKTGETVRLLSAADGRG
jgi:hypothetical protein